MDFPDETLLTVFAHLSSVEDKLAVTRVNRDWRRVALDATLWRATVLPLREALLIFSLAPDAVKCMEISMRVHGEVVSLAEPTPLEKILRAAQTRFKFHFPERFQLADVLADPMAMLRVLSETVRDVVIRGIHETALCATMNRLGGDGCVVESLTLNDCEIHLPLPTLVPPREWDSEDALPELQRILAMHSFPVLRHFTYRRKAGNLVPYGALEAYLLAYLYSVPFRCLETLTTRIYSSAVLVEFDLPPLGQPFLGDTLKSLIVEHDAVGPLVVGERFPCLETLIVLRNYASVVLGYAGSTVPPRLRTLGTEFGEIDPGHVFPHLTHLTVHDRIPFRPEVATDPSLIREAQFPVLRSLTYQSFKVNTDPKAWPVAAKLRTFLNEFHTSPLHESTVRVPAAEHDNPGRKSDAFLRELPCPSWFADLQAQAATLQVRCEGHYKRSPHGILVLGGEGLLMFVVHLVKE